MTLPGFPDAAPLAGLGGGLLIGLAAAVMLLGTGHIAGVSGVVAQATGMSGSGLPRSSAWLFLISLPLGAFLAILVSGDMESSFASPFVLAIAGFLVGAGTRLGGGCTSGHGVCGMSRLSPRSLVATATFMLTGFATVAIMNAVGLKALS